MTITSYSIYFAESDDHWGHERERDWVEDARPGHEVFEEPDVEGFLPHAQLLAQADTFWDSPAAADVIFRSLKVVHEYCHTCRMEYLSEFVYSYVED